MGVRMTRGVNSSERVAYWETWGPPLLDGIELHRKRHTRSRNSDGNRSVGHLQQVLLQFCVLLEAVLLHRHEIRWPYLDLGPELTGPLDSSHTNNNDITAVKDQESTSHVDIDIIDHDHNEQVADSEEEHDAISQEGRLVHDCLGSKRNATYVSKKDAHSILTMMVTMNTSEPRF